MSASEISQLAKLMPPPTDRMPVRHAWEEVEAELGVRFPDDFRALIETYGSGAAGDDIYWIDPRSPAFKRSLKDFLWIHHRSPDGEFPMPLFPAQPVSLMQVGANGDGYAILLVVDHGEADDSIIWIGCLDGPSNTWWQRPGPFSALLCGLIRGDPSMTEVLGERLQRQPLFVPREPGSR